MLSKELLGEVLGTTVKTIELDDNAICYNNFFVLNIYELANKCKTWAYVNKNCTLSSGKCPEGNWFAIEGITGKQTHSDTEPEAIFKACEWILNEQHR